MSEQLLNPTLWVPILVVLITWYLGNLSAKRNYAENKRQVIACLTSKLTLVYTQLSYIELSQYLLDDQKAFDSVLNNQEKEDLRQRIIGSNLLASEQMISELRVSISAYSRFEPIHALKVTKEIDKLVIYKNQKPQESIDNEHLYDLIKGRNKLRVESIMHSIRKDVKRLAFSHSFFLYVEVNFYLYKIKRNIVNDINEKLCSLKDSSILIRATHNKHFKSNS